ncbi:MAG: hypothetical protein EOP51_08865 [Sphingobacteriales bacterium]|nr:MAG: hypothetical protein EOP51_08865 [Sphingobacteriales bacterium]
MKRILYLTLILLAVASISNAQKTIFAGGEITYEHIADSTYQFYANLYQDCAGEQEPTTITACFQYPCDTGYSFSTTLTKQIHVAMLRL